MSEKKDNAEAKIFLDLSMMNETDAALTEDDFSKKAEKMFKDLSVHVNKRLTQKD